MLQKSTAAAKSLLSKKSTPTELQFSESPIKFHTVEVTHPRPATSRSNPLLRLEQFVPFELFFCPFFSNWEREIEVGSRREERMGICVDGAVCYFSWMAAEKTEVGPTLV